MSLVLWLYPVVVVALLLVVEVVGTVRDRRRVPPRPARRSSTVSMLACRLVKGSMVLTHSTPYRYRVEQVLWIERQPFGPIVANLEGTDPETGATQRRWHTWQSSERVTVFTADVVVDGPGGNYDELIRRFGQGVQQQQDELDRWHRAFG
jgi:hypothetical protein